MKRLRRDTAVLLLSMILTLEKEISIAGLSMKRSSYSRPMMGMCVKKVTIGFSSPNGRGSRREV